MKRLSLILSLLLGLVTSPVYAVQKIATIDVPDHPPPPLPTQLRKVVVLIQAVCKTDDKRLVVESGTGFIVGYSPSTATGKSFDYLVTNRHVAECWETAPAHGARSGGDSGWDRSQRCVCPAACSWRLRARAGTPEGSCLARSRVPFLLRAGGVGRVARAQMHRARSRGTEGSNPAPSSSESDANLNFAGASRSNDRLPALADDLVRRRVTVIAATSTPWPWRERRRRR